MIVPVGEKRWCLICRSVVAEGQEFVPHPGNVHVGRHATCEPKAKKKWVQSKASDQPAKKKMKGSATKRRAGGHGYAGGDGFVSI